MDLSVIIVTCDSAEHIDACLGSLERHLDGPSREICVVDNASRDPTVELVRRHPQATLILNARNVGFAAAINRGLASTTGRYVLWLNPDSVVRDGGAATVLAYLDAHPDVGIVGPRILDPDGRLQRSARSFPSYDWALGHRHSLLTRLFPANPYSKRYLRTDLDPSTVQDVDWVSGACLVHRRELVDRIGGLDERFFMYCEDVDFCLRAHRAACKVRYHPALTVTHHVAGSTRLRPAAMLVERHRSLWRYYRKHFPRRAFVNLLAWSAIWGRCALVVAQDLVAKPFRSRPGVTASFMRADLERASPELVASVPSHGRPGAAALERAAARIVGSPAKRAFDVLVAGSGLLLSAPLWTLFALAVKLEDGGPVFYSQARVGLGGRAFRAFKFRSMVPDAERAVGAVQAAHGDPRVTRVGRLLRATAMDELPQLWNIFRGDMTFVGPRALRPGEIEANGSGALEPLEDVPGFAERCLVRPGLTGLAQIYASRRLPRRDKFRYDRLYIRRQSFWLDLRLILYSFWISVTGTWEVRGRAYPS